MAPKQRRIVLVVLLGATLSATAWVNFAQDNASVSETQPQPQARRTVDKPSATRKTPPKVEALTLEPLQRPVLENTKKSLFDSKSWYVPPPPPKALPPPPPMAPPLPFSYMGKMLEEGRTTVFLTQQNRNFVVKAGDTIESAYRVDEINARFMTLTYLPLNIKQTLQIGETN